MVVIKLLNYTIQVPVPWLQIFLSPPVWGIIITHFCGNFGFYVLLTTMPTYFSQALGFDLGTVRSVVYVSVCVCVCVCLCISVCVYIIIYVCRLYYMLS